jgi:hypothetical protein
MKMAVFWDLAPCSLVHTDRRLKGAYCLQHPGDEQAERGKVGVDIRVGWTRQNPGRTNGRGVRPGVRIGRARKPMREGRPQPGRGGGGGGVGAR